MLATSDPDRIDIAFDDDRLVADAGSLPAAAEPRFLTGSPPATLARPRTTRPVRPR